MKIGVYFSDIKPEAGGASSLLKTIQNEIMSSDISEHDFIFLYNGHKLNSLFINRDGFNYLDLDYFKLNKLKKSINHLKKIKDPSFCSFSVFDVAAKKYGIDLFWFPHPIFTDINYPYIFTIWDLGHRTTPFFPEVSRSGATWGTRECTYQKMVYKASYIITGNEEGKKEILENYPMNENKIRISAFPVASFCRGNEIKPAFDIPEQYFFYPAQFWPHKNHIRILEALVYLRENYKLEPYVFLTGSDKGNKKYIEEQIIELGLQNQVKITGFLKDEELKYLYTHATAMIFASLMGPNNMPPIEATYLNCPVIITDLDGHKEQLGDTALYFNGYDKKQLAEQMKTVLTDEQLRNRLKEKEKLLAKDFDKINYFSCIKKIIDEFAEIRKTWGKDFIHL